MERMVPETPFDELDGEEKQDTRNVLMCLAQASFKEVGEPCEQVFAELIDMHDKGNLVIGFDLGNKEVVIYHYDEAIKDYVETTRLRSYIRE